MLRIIKKNQEKILDKNRAVAEQLHLDLLLNGIVINSNELTSTVVQKIVNPRKRF